ncbi:MAG: hypothetical protein IKF31_09440 [Clostridiales bacterium]|jgi:hypothetical protein|nr:hypothetical protein [Clostridiales bacterium]
MFPDLAIRIKSYAADMGSGFVVIAGFLLAITLVFVIVFARWNGIKNNSSTYVNVEKPRVESTVDTGHVSLILPEEG